LNKSIKLYVIPDKHFKAPLSIHSEKLTKGKLAQLRMVFLLDWTTLISNSNGRFTNESGSRFLSCITNQKVWLN